MPTSARNNHPQKGLTLIELLITLSILSLGALIAASAMNKALPQRTLDYAAEQLVTDLKRARLEALKTGTPTSLRISDDGYTIAGILDRKFNNAIIVSLDTDDDEVVFQKSFATLGSAIILIKGERRAVVAVQPITGKIERIE